ncbi:ArsR/SmtB family transcription factor [Micromonospora sp. WMMD735]|uniref:ArsR/SmtB family transcription factor n=1 Tax=Micromonospora sp. WMMD735 TaxID=3404130 RepID=UPI003B92C608
MSRQELPVLADPSACCAPMVTEALTEDAAAALARGFKALGDPVRLRLLSLIAARAGGEVCVCELTDAFTLTGPTISHHLKVLREAGLIDCQRRGTWVYYWVVPARLAVLSQLLDVSAAAASTGPTR